jgi:hypothetical protein
MLGTRRDGRRSVDGLIEDVPVSPRSGALEAVPQVILLVKRTIFG